MATLTDSDIQDLVKGTLKELGKGRFNQIATTLVSYECMSKLWKQDRVDFEPALGIQRTILTDHNSMARHVGQYETDIAAVNDAIQTIDVPWRRTTTNWSYSRDEMLVNAASPQRIFDLIKVRKAQGYIALAELMEQAFWSKPTDSTDKLKPFGVPYWLVANATAGFNGGDPSGFSAGAGNLTAATAPAWQNYTALYTAVSKADLITKLRTAYRNINFKSPIDIQDYRKGTGQRYRLYMNEATIRPFEDLAEAQNENLGRDVASMDGTVTFRRNPTIWVPFLDNTTSPTNPVYMIDFGVFHVGALKGAAMKETEPLRSATQHTVFTVHVDLTWQIYTDSRRSHACLCTAV